MNVAAPGVSESRPYRPSDALRGDAGIANIHPRVSANAELLGSREIAHPALLDAIQNAKHSVAIGQYIFWDAGRGAELLEALLDRAHDVDPIRVDVLLDREGSLLYPGFPARRRFQALQSDTFRVTMYAARLNVLRGPVYHPKMIVIDGTDAFVGSMAFDAREWGDSMLRVRGAVAEQALAEHTASWVSARGAIGSHQVELLRRADANVQPDALIGTQMLANRPGRNLAATTDLLDRMRAATDRIWVQTPFLGSVDFVRELRAAAARGVDTRLRVAGFGKGTPAPLFPALSATFFRELLSGDTPVLVLQQRASATHEKEFLIDNMATTGSVNATKRAFWADVELNVNSNEPQVLRQFEAKLQADQAAAHVVSHADLTSPGMRFLNAPPGRIVRGVLGAVA